MNKHTIERLRPVFDGSTYVGCLMATAKGFVCYDRHSNSVGCFVDPERAVRKLRILAAQSK